MDRITKNFITKNISIVKKWITKYVMIIYMV